MLQLPDPINKTLLWAAKGDLYPHVGGTGCDLFYIFCTYPHVLKEVACFVYIDDEDDFEEGDEEKRPRSGEPIDECEHVDSTIGAHGEP